MIVTEKAKRPVSDAEQCFYCKRPLGEEHRPDCMLVKKKVRVRAVVEYEVTVPACWGKKEVEFRRNEGGWCADNMIDELVAWAAKTEVECLCHYTRFEFLKDASAPFLEEI